MRGVLKLTQLAFADDLLLFSRADVSSVCHLLAALNRFSDCSGLQAAEVIVISGISEDKKKAGDYRTHSFFYGIPSSYWAIFSGRLSRVDCPALVGKITASEMGLETHILRWTLCPHK